MSCWLLLHSCLSWSPAGHGTTVDEDGAANASQTTCAPAASWGSPNVARIKYAYTHGSSSTIVDSVIGRRVEGTYSLNTTRTKEQHAKGKKDCRNERKVNSVWSYWDRNEASTQAHPSPPPAHLRTSLCNCQLIQSITTSYLHVVARAAARNDIVPSRHAAFAFWSHVVEGHFRFEAFGAAISERYG